MSIAHTISEVYASRELLVALTLRDIRVRYKQAIFGVMWVFFMPVLAISSGIIIRLAMAFYAGQTAQLGDIVAVMVKSLPWLLFAGILSTSANSLVGAQSLITKIYFPREVMPISSVLTACFDFVVSLVGLSVLFAIMALFTSLPLVLSWQVVFIPLLVALLVFMATGLGMMLACANLFFRDVKYIVNVAMQFGVFFSLVYFSYRDFGDWGWVFLLNPVTPILETIAAILLTGQCDPVVLPYLAGSVVVAAVLFVSALQFFDQAEHLFAEAA